jgi:hypothetical protein
MEHCSLRPCELEYEYQKASEWIKYKSDFLLFSVDLPARMEYVLLIIINLQRTPCRDPLVIRKRLTVGAQIMILQDVDLNQIFR